MSEPDAAASGGDVAAELRRGEQALKERDQDVARIERQQESRDRSAVTSTVMAVFATSLLTSLIVLAIAGLFSGVWTTIGPLIVDIVKSVVLPVTTLVLGYYFGRGGRS